MTTTDSTTAPPAELFRVVATGRNGGTTEFLDLTLDEARSLMTRRIGQGKARRVDIYDAAGQPVGFMETAL